MHFGKKVEVSDFRCDIEDEEAKVYYFLRVPFDVDRVWVLEEGDYGLKEMGVYAEEVRQGLMAIRSEEEFLHSRK